MGWIKGEHSAAERPQGGLHPPTDALPPPAPRPKCIELTVKFNEADVNRWDRWMKRLEDDGYVTAGPSSDDLLRRDVQRRLSAGMVLDPPESSVVLI